MTGFHAVGSKDGDLSLTCPGEVIREPLVRIMLTGITESVKKECGVQAAGEHGGDMVGNGGANELHPHSKPSSEISRQPSLQETFLK